MKTKFLLLALICILTASLSAQTKEELTAQKTELETQINALKTQVSEIETKIQTDFPDYGWKKGLFGTVGANLTGFNNWVTAANPDSRNITIQGSFNAFANRNEEKYFWNNSLNLNLGWQRLIKDNTMPLEEEKEFSQTADIFNINSLYGYKLNSKFAISGLGEYRTNLLNNFNNPGYLDLGVGATWTPINDLIVVFHPLNYNIIFADDENMYQSSLGTKILATYTRTIAERFNWKSNLSAFVSYKDLDALSNYTWTNGISFTAFKGIGIGIEYALRINKQETIANGSDKTLQQYFIIGLTYSL
ncbi:MAG: DUF3078 domain-containing protein [Saprospiraceae bacterium]|nr:DUF3078 domain-containing protein [Saprospiraceae bacterium]